MDSDFSTPPAFRDPVVKWLLGFFGAILGFLFLPRTLKYLVRKFVFGMIGEIVAIVLTGLLTEKAVEYLGQQDKEIRGQ